MAAPPTPAIELNDLHLAFGPKVVLQGASLNIAKGDIQVILGGSGSGKSVLLRCMLGLLQPNRGQVRVFGQTPNVRKIEAHAKLMARCGMLFQNSALFDSLTIWENVAFTLLQKNVGTREAKKVALQKLGMVGLASHVADLFPAELSGGMKKRAALARAICGNPEVILYDEPTTGLDPITADVINDLILKLQKELQCTSVVITHDMHSAFKLADRMAFLYQGTFLAEGPAASFEKSSNPYVRQFVEGRAEGPIAATV
jgi:phospholipid/cholesterol/gamma-HCH transport system ATP-binding protein